MFIHTYYNTLNRTFNPINQVIQTIVNYIDFVELKKYTDHLHMFYKQ